MQHRLSLEVSQSLRHCYAYIVPDYMILCPPDEGRYMTDEGSYTGTILDKACDSDNCPIKCFRHHIWCLKHFIRAVI